MDDIGYMRWVDDNKNIPTGGAEYDHQCFDYALNQCQALLWYLNLVTNANKEIAAAELTPTLTVKQAELQAASEETLEGFKRDITKAIRDDLPAAGRWLYMARDQMADEEDNEHNRDCLVWGVYILLAIASICDADLDAEQFTKAILQDGVHAMFDFRDLMNSVQQLWKDRAAAEDLIDNATIEGGNE